MWSVDILSTPFKIALVSIRPSVPEKWAMDESSFILYAGTFNSKLLCGRICFCILGIEPGFKTKGYWNVGEELLTGLGFSSLVVTNIWRV